MIKNLLLRWLGLDGIHNQFMSLTNEMRAIGYDVHLIHENTKNLPAFGSALGRIIAKIDPHYTESDLSTAKRAESDRIGEEAMTRILAEEQARRHTTGGL